MKDFGETGVFMTLRGNAFLRKSFHKKAFTGNCFPGGKTSRKNAPGKRIFLEEI